MKTLISNKFIHYKTNTLCEGAWKADTLYSFYSHYIKRWGYGFKNIKQIIVTQVEE